MKTIIIPTDFSPAADNAMHYGAQVAQLVAARLLLLHVYTVPVTLSDMPVMLLSVEELRKGSNDGLARYQQELQTKYPNLQVDAESRLGDIVDELKEACHRTDPLAVVMSTHKTSGVEQIFFGSNTIASIRQLRHPVITVPVEYKFSTIKTIVLATDLQNVAKTPVRKIIEIVNHLKASLQIVHVRSKEEDQNTSGQLIDQFGEPAPSFHTIQDDDIIHGLQSYTEKVRADLLIVLPHEHSWLETFFFKLHTKQLVHKARLPMLCIPE